MSDSANGSRLYWPQGADVRYPVNALIRLVQELGQDAIKAREHGVRARLKADRTFVSEADLHVERRLFEEIGSFFPDDGFFGEEGHGKSSTSGRTWIVDPIDGTQQYVRGQDFWGILVACVVDGQPEFGIISHPSREEVIWAVRNGGCFERGVRGDAPLRVSDITDLEDSYVLHNGIDFASQTGHLPQLREIVRVAQAERGYADSFGHAEVIRGRAEVMIDFLAEPQDVAAVALCVTEAGGCWRGTGKSDTVERPGAASITSNAAIADQIQAMLLPSRAQTEEEKR